MSTDHLKTLCERIRERARPPFKPSEPKTLAAQSFDMTMKLPDGFSESELYCWLFDHDELLLIVCLYDAGSLRREQLGT